MTINELKSKAYQNADEHGFYKNLPSLECVLNQVNKELEELKNAESCNIENVETVTNCNSTNEFKKQFEKLIKDTVEDELADCFILLASICGYMDIDIEKHIKLKIKYNTLRPYLHGKDK